MFMCLQLSAIKIEKTQSRLQLQGQAEGYLEKLHGMAEKRLTEVYEALRDDATSTALHGQQQHHSIRPEWAKFRETLIGLTDVTRAHFQKLVEVGLM